MPVIEKLSPDQLAEYSLKGFAVCGLKRDVARTLCRCLELQPDHPRGLMGLGLFLDFEPARPLAAAVLEHLLSSAFSLDAQTRAEVDRTQLMLKWTWEFARHESGERNLQGVEFEEPTQFVCDDERYWQFLNPVVTQAGSLPACAEAGARLLGLMCGALHHPTFRLEDLGQGIPPIIFEERVFARPGEYLLWLKNNDTDELDNVLGRASQGQRRSEGTDGQERDTQATRSALRPGECIVRAPGTHTATIVDGCSVTIGSVENQLDDVASFIWSQIESPRTEEQIVAAIIDAYNIDKATAAKDVRDFLLELLDSGCAHRTTVAPVSSAPKNRLGWLTARLWRWGKPK